MTRRHIAYMVRIKMRRSTNLNMDDRTIDLKIKAFSPEILFFAGREDKIGTTLDIYICFHILCAKIRFAVSIIGLFSDIFSVSYRYFYIAPIAQVDRAPDS